MNFIPIMVSDNLRIEATWELNHVRRKDIGNIRFGAIWTTLPTQFALWVCLRSFLPFF